MKFQRQVLPNGIRLLTIPMPSFESATVMVMVGAGSRYENRKNSGISHFLEHMAFKGTEMRPSGLAISELIDGIGGEFNAFTGKETTGYYVKAASANVELCMDVLSDMLMHSLLDAGEIEKEKGVIIEELNLYEDTPSRKIGDIYERLLYGDTAMGWEVGGEKDIIMKIQRADFMEYLASLYSANNITVVVAGGVTQNYVAELAGKYFGSMKSFDTMRYKEVMDKQEKPAVLIKQKKTEQVHIALGVRTISISDPKRFPLWILSSVLGGGMSSRLFTEVREKRGLGYYVRTHSDQYQDCGSLVSMAGVDPKRVDEAVSVIRGEYIAVATGKNPITNSELQKAKEYVKGHLVLELEDSRSVAAYYAGQELLEKEIDNPDQVLLKLDKVTLTDVNESAREFLKLPLSLAVIGNFEDSRRFEKLIV